MTLRVYRINAATGEQTELPHVDPSPLTIPVAAPLYPPCVCPRCQPPKEEA